MNQRHRCRRLKDHNRLLKHLAIRLLEELDRVHHPNGILEIEMERNTKRLSDLSEPELRSTMDAVGSAIKRVLPEKTLFVCLATEAEGKVCQYVSNAQREGVIGMLREFITALEQHTDQERKEFP